MDLRPLTDDALYARLEALACAEREALADVVEHLMEADRRDNIFARGYGSLFDYSKRKLGYSDFGALARIRAARASRDHPEVLAKLRSGALHLDAIVRLYPHLTVENRDSLLERASGATTLQVKALVADLKAPEPPAPDKVVPRPAAASEPLPLAPVAEVIAPPRRVLIQFEASERFLAKIDRLKSLLRNKYPFARLEEIFEDAADSLLAKKDPDRKILRNCGQPQLHRSGRKREPNRWVPEAVKRAVRERDGGRCAFVSDDGRRCESVDALQYDHVVPYALGGPSDDPANIRLLCRAHNQWLARRKFGPRPR